MAPTGRGRWSRQHSLGKSGCSQQRGHPPSSLHPGPRREPGVALSTHAAGAGAWLTRLPASASSSSGVRLRLEKGLRARVARGDRRAEVDTAQQPQGRGGQGSRRHGPRVRAEGRGGLGAAEGPAQERPWAVALSHPLSPSQSTRDNAAAEATVSPQPAHPRVSARATVPQPQVVGTSFPTEDGAMPGLVQRHLPWPRRGHEGPKVAITRRSRGAMLPDTGQPPRGGKAGTRAQRPGAAHTRQSHPRAGPFTRGWGWA